MYILLPLFICSLTHSLTRSHTDTHILIFATYSLIYSHLLTHSLLYIYYTVYALMCVWCVYAFALLLTSHI